MTRRYSIAEARKCLPAIFAQTASGFEVQLTRRGQPVAVVLSIHEFDRLQERRRHFRDAYKHFLTRYSLNELGADPELFETARDRTAGPNVEP
jgi:prevent-host-death family protein